MNMPACKQELHYSLPDSMSISGFTQRLRTMQTVPLTQFPASFWAEQNVKVDKTENKRKTFFMVEQTVYYSSFFPCSLFEDQGMTDAKNPRLVFRLFFFRVWAFLISTANSPNIFSCFVLALSRFSSLSLFCVSLSLSLSVCLFFQAGTVDYLLKRKERCSLNSE